MLFITRETSLESWRMSFLMSASLNVVLSCFFKWIEVVFVHIIELDVVFFIKEVKSLKLLLYWYNTIVEHFHLIDYLLEILSSWSIGRFVIISCSEVSSRYPLKEFLVTLTSFPLIKSRKRHGWIKLFETSILDRWSDRLCEGEPVYRICTYVLLTQVLSILINIYKLHLWNYYFIFIVMLDLNLYWCKYFIWHMIG